MEPSNYETRARDEIRAWKNPELNWFGRAAKAVNAPLDAAGDAVMKIPGVGWVIETTVGGIVTLGNDAAQWSIRPEAILEEYRAAGHTTVKDLADIAQLDLADIDRAQGWIGAKYRALAAAEGAATGAAGLPGIPIDVVALVTMNLRAIGEYATYCGFDVSSESERLYAMNVLGLASSPTDASKAVAMAQLVRIAKDVAKRRVWRDLERQAFVKLLQKIAKSLGIRLTKAKLAQSLPVVGAVVEQASTRSTRTKSARRRTSCIESEFWLASTARIGWHRRGRGGGNRA